MKINHVIAWIIIVGGRRIFFGAGEANQKPEPNETKEFFIHGQIDCPVK